MPADWLAAATRPSQSLEKSYGYLWWNNTTGKWPGVPADAFAAIGKFDNDMLIVPSLDLIVIRQVGDETGNEHTVNVAECSAWLSKQSTIRLRSANDGWSCVPGVLGSSGPEAESSFNDRT